MSDRIPILQCQPRHVVNLADVVRENHIITMAVGSDGEPAILSLVQVPDYRSSAPNECGFPKQFASHPNDFSVHYRRNGEWQTIHLERTSENYHHLQPLGQDKWLLVRGRAKGNEDANASVYDMNGQRLWAFNAGDGIQDVQATEDGSVWVSFFDEGVFGDSALGPSGLVQLNDHGQVLFSYNDHCDEVNLPYIADCYAFNAAFADNEVWLYYYDGFPLVRLRDGRAAGSWQSIPMQGSRAFAVHGQQALFLGSYEERDVLFLLDLKSMVTRRVLPLDMMGQPLNALHGTGRQSQLYLWGEGALYCLDLKDFH